MSRPRFDVEIPTCREGVFVPCGSATPDDVIKCVRLAERLGACGRTTGEFDVLAEGELLLAKTREAAGAAYRKSR